MGEIVTREPMEYHSKNQGNLSPQTKLVFGLGRSGKALCNFLTQKKERFYVADDRGASTFADLLHAYPDASWLETTSLELFPFDEILLSPGIALNHPFLQKVKQNGIAITSELEFAARLTDIPLIAITGTNGKSTTTALVAHFLTQAKIKTMPCGNFGTPLIEALFENKMPWDTLVVEVSSFQGETSPTFKPHLVALLNLTPDHLDRYPSIDDYLHAKEAIVKNQEKHDILVYNAEEPAFVPCVGRSKARGLPFSSAKTLPMGAFIKGGHVIIRVDGKEEMISLAHNPLVGLHHLENILAASLLAYVYGVPAAAIEAALASFKGLRHRLELVAEKHGVRFYDDSKATNVGALAMSLASFEEKVILIAGGRDKESDFHPLAPLVRAKVHAICLIGEAATKIAAAWSDTGELIMCDTLDKAVRTAFDRARLSGSPVLLAPACASFDQFKDYKDRGEKFCAAVHALC